MGIFENSIGAMFGQGSGDNNGPSFGSAPYAPLATALIGLLAAKAATGGFGNLGGLFGGGQSGQAAAPQAPQQGQEPQGAGGLLSGLGGLLHQFQQSGHGEVAQSWVGSGQNAPVNPGQLSQAIGPDLIRALSQKTGIPEEQISQQLSQELPALVDKLTPQGRIPTHGEASSFLNGSNPLQQ